jgi:hypothetical protein
MEVVQLVAGHNFHVDWHFKFLVEKGENLPKGQYLLFTAIEWHTELTNLLSKIY